MTTITLYHGTDVYSALDILNNGLNPESLIKLQVNPVQLGPGLYTALDLDVAWFFASLAPNAETLEYTVIEISLPVVELKYLLDRKEARIEPLVQGQFRAERIWFSSAAFDFLNQVAEFKPIG
ncbi:hypothetical protein NG791_00065 [Laspinema sp. D1]|uniref:hypothetical protein n=1 Tax=Laspinema palackyanum TaxID=3231601 RepID=UPI00347FD232|nr:hypothetical protein [Laspinema sp. D2b]